jgi:hypothetical protein
LQETREKYKLLVENHNEELERMDKARARKEKDQKLADEKKKGTEETIEEIVGDLEAADVLAHYVQALRQATTAVSARNFAGARKWLGECPRKMRGWEWSYLNERCDDNAVSGWTAPDVTVEYSAGSARASAPPGKAGKTKTKVAKPAPALGASVAAAPAVMNLRGAELYYARRIHRYAAFSPDSRRLACINAAREVKLFDLTTGKLVRTFVPPSEAEAVPQIDPDAALFSLAFSGDGSHILAIAEHDALVWNVQQRTPVKSHPRPKLFNLMCRDAAGDRVLVASWTGTASGQQKYAVRLWDAETGDKWPGLADVADNVLANLLDLNLSLSIDGQTLIALWQARRQEAVQSASINLASGDATTREDPAAVDEKSGRYVQRAVNPRAMAPSGKRLVDASGISETSKGELLLPLDRLLDASGLAADGEPLTFDWSPDGKRIAIVAGKSVRVLTIADGSRFSGRTNARGRSMTWQLIRVARKADQSGFVSPASSARWFRALAAALAVLCASAIAAADKKEKKADAGAAKAATGSSTSLVDELKAAFDEGLVFGASRLKEAHKHLALAKKLAPSGDWRIDYAAGLIYLRQSQVNPAIAQFEAAAKPEPTVNWPAWKALIWSHFVARHNDEGLQALDRFAVVVKNAGQPGEFSDEKRDAARWIGQLLESLARCGESLKLRNRVEEQEARLVEILGEELAESIELGREIIRERELELGRESDADDAQETARRKKEAARIGKKSAGIKDTKEKNARTADEWKTWLDQTLSTINKQLDKLEAQYQDCEQQAALSMQSYFRATMTGTPRGPLGTNVLDKMNELETWRAQYNVAVARRSAVIEQALLALQQRDTAIRDYQQATGKIVNENAALDKWSGRLKNQKQKLDVDQPGGQLAKKGKAGNPKPAPADKKQQFTLKTFLPLNLEDERDRVLESYAASKTGGRGEESHPEK